MDYRRFLVEFMEAKAYELMRLGVNPDLYFNDEDREDILGWDKNEARKIYYKLKDNIRAHSIFGLAWFVCPFCIKGVLSNNIEYFNKFVCSKCLYGERHGKCPYEGSDYNIITKTLEAKGLQIIRFFSYSFYDNLISSMAEDSMIKAEEKYFRKQYLWHI